MRLKFPTSEQFLFLANVTLERLLFPKVKFAKPVKEILVIKWDEIGDMAVSTHVFAGLKKQFPEAHIHLICKPFVRNLIEHDPNVDFIAETIDAYNRPFDLIVELRGTWKSLLKTFRYWPRNRVSRAMVRWKNRGRQWHEIDTNWEVIRPLLDSSVNEETPKLYFSASDAVIVDEFISSHKIGKFAVIHAGARRKLRQWPLERFALVVEYLHRKYHLDVVFAGTSDDEEDISRITGDLGFMTYNFTKGFSLSQFSCLCSRASLYIGNESGPLHIASSFKVPLVALFGPGVKDVFYPQGPSSKVLHYVLSCNPCDQIHCVEPQNPCIGRIQVQEVLDQVDALISSGK